MTSNRHEMTRLGVLSAPVKGVFFEISAAGSNLTLSSIWLATSFSGADCLDDVENSA